MPRRLHVLITLPVRCDGRDRVPRERSDVSVAKTDCADPLALTDYAACGTACGKTYDSSATKRDASGDAFSSITGAVEADGSDSTGVSHYRYEECRGTRPSAPVTFTACSGTRDVPVTFASCEGTVDTPVSYSVCDGFVTICPETPMSVRLSQAMAYAATWMSALAFAYNFLGRRELERRMDRVVEKNDLVDADEGEDDAPAAKPGGGAKEDGVTATVTLEKKASDAV